jgi:putative MATE family efflux protein
MSILRSRELDLTQGVIWKQLLLFFIPIWCGVFFQQLYNTVDTIIVGRFVGTEALAAVGDTAAFIDLLIGFFTGLASGATIILAQYFGARESELVGRGAHTAVILSVLAGILFTFIGWFSAPYVLRAMSTPDEIIGQSVLYLRIFCVGMVPNAIFNMGTGILRAVGDSKRPVWFLAAACICNIALDLLFVVVFGMGVGGAAAATAISQAVSAALTLWSLSRPNRGAVRLYLSRLRPDWRIAGRILRVGVPAALQSSMYSVTNIFIQAGVNYFSTTTIAAWAVYGKLDFIYWMSVNSLGMSLTTFSSQNFGAGKTERMKRGFRSALVIGLAITAAYGSLLLLFGRQLFGVFTTDRSVVDIGVYMMRILVPSYVLFLGIELCSDSIRGTGEVMGPMIITCFSICVLRLAWLFAVLPHFRTFAMLCYSYPITWGVGSALFILYYRFGRWRDRRMGSGAETPT